MTPLYLVTLGGISFSGKEAAIAAAVVVVLVVIGAFLVRRSRRR